IVVIQSDIAIDVCGDVAYIGVALGTAWCRSLFEKLSSNQEKRDCQMERLVFFVPEGRTKVARSFTAWICGPNRHRVALHPALKGRATFMRRSAAVSTLGERSSIRGAQVSSSIPCRSVSLGAHLPLLERRT